jgi:hypothetical protein
MGGSCKKNFRIFGFGCISGRVLATTRRRILLLPTGTDNDGILARLKTKFDEIVHKEAAKASDVILVGSLRG